jgi:ketosteroid isomerase-like protein
MRSRPRCSAEVLATIGRQFELKSYQPETVIVQGDRAAALIRTSFVQRSTGRTMNMHFATFMRVAHGRVIEFKEFSDTFDVGQQALGASLHVPAIAV